MEHKPSRSYDTSAFSTEAVDAAPRRVVVDPTNRFLLDPAFLAEFEGKQPAWGPIGYVVYKRTYARRVGSGDAQRSEEFWETLRRVTEGTFSLLKQQIRGAHRPWDDAEAQRKAQDFYRRMWAFKWLPPGRGLWIMGTEYLERHGGGAANNCGFVSTARVADDFSAPFCALMDWSMLGVGMGFDTRGAGKVRVVRPALGGTYVVQDTREGWIDLIRTTLSAYVGVGALPYQVDVSGVRRAGEPINGFGGTASGPEPLLELWAGAQRILGAIEGQLLTSAAITDLMNLIGRCVVAGNVRRSSEIALGDIGDADFLALKDPTRDREIAAEQRRIELAHGIDIAATEAAQRQHSPLSPEFAEAQRGIDDLKARRYHIPEWAALDAERWALPLNAWRWASNNTVWADSATGDDLRRVGERIAHNGEPGIGWLDLMRSHGRLSDPATNDDSFADGMNPCQPDFATVLTPDGVRTFAEIDAGSFIWSGKRWTKVLKKWATGVKDVFEYQTTAGRFVGTADHKVISEGERLRADDAECIDTCQGNSPDASDSIDPADVMDGWVIGDGSVHKASGDLVYLNVGVKDGDVHSLGDLVRCHRPGINGYAWTVCTTIEPHELPKTYERTIPARFRFGSSTKVRGFLRGLYSANGSVVGGRVMLKAASIEVIKAVQEMLSSIGIPSYFTSNRGKNVLFSNGEYKCRDSFDLNITRGRVAFAALIGFVQNYKTEKLREICNNVGKSSKKPKISYEVSAKTHLGQFPVYDITVDDEEHTYWTGGMLVSNCGEQTLWDAELCCVSADTRILARNGYPKISNVVGQEIEIWNGKNWSTVRPFVAARGKKLYRIHLSDGSHLDATADHAWSACAATGRVYRRVETLDLREGMYLEECEPPKSDGGVSCEYAYQAGWMAGDGFIDGNRPVALVQQMEYSVLPFLGGVQYPEQHPAGYARPFRRVSLKDVVPLPLAQALRDYTTGLPEEVFTWDAVSLSLFFGGWIDTDGCLRVNPRTDHYVLHGAERKLRDAQMLLRRIGVNHATLRLAAEEGEETNYGTRTHDLWCLLIPSYEAEAITTKLKQAKRFGSRFAPNNAHENSALIDRARKQKVLLVEELAGDHEVYCFSESERHMGVFGNVLTYQCLVETFPTKHLDGGRFDLDDYKATLKMAYLYAKVVSGIPTHRADTNSVMAANRRIGTSQAGIVELYETLGLSECRRIWDEGYRYVTELDAEYSRWMACPRSIKRTSVKPGGSIPLLPGVEGGMKWPSSRFYMRTVRIDRGNAMVPVLQRLGYRVEPNYTENRSVVAYFPVRSNARRFAAQVSLWEQAELAAALQAYWSDNMVSCTLTFRKEEAADVPRVIEAFSGRLKTVSFLPVEEHGYLQAPYIPCSQAEYEAAVAAITGDVSEALSAALGGVETKAEDERFCSGERCEWRPAT